MKLLLTTIAAVVLVGCGKSQQSAPTPEAKPVEPVAEATKPITPPKAVTANKGADPARGIKPEPQTGKAPDISIHEAAMMGNIEVVKQHIAAGTDVNVEGGKFKRTPLQNAIRHKEIVQLLIAAGADVNAKGSIGKTALHITTQYNIKETAALLIAAGADVNARDIQGRTPLEFPIRMRDTEIIALLRKHGGKTGEELKAEGK